MTEVSVRSRRPDRLPGAATGRAAAAAFYDLDGTLVRTNLVHVLLFYARNDRGLLRSLRRTAVSVASIPLFFAAEQVSRHAFNQVFFRFFQGLSADRLRLLAEELWEEVLRPALRPEAAELIEASRARGLRQVLVTGAFDLAVAPLVRELGFDDCAANRLDMVGGAATGRLVPPVMAGAAKAEWIRAYAEREGLSLGSCYAYADSLSDLPMLSVVGRPTPINPDLGLRRVAREQGWPVLWLK
ncbi:MAG TPA: HAD family phosphatase [Vicinamibacteria bacterium]|nr:HAD family phosphatase [Vicinamibacteria bacterium]